MTAVICAKTKDRAAEIAAEYGMSDDEWVFEESLDGIAGGTAVFFNGGEEDVPFSIVPRRMPVYE